VAGDAEDFLDRIPDPDRQALLALGVQRPIAPRTAVLHEGDEAHEVLVLLEGSVKVTRLSPDGREVVVGVRTASQLVGEVATVDGHRRSASVWTLEPCQVHRIPGADFLDLLGHRPAMAMALIEALCARLRESTDQVLEFGTQDALARVSRRLVELAPPGAALDTTEVELGISQQELAARCGLSREAVVKALRVLRTVGWIEQDGRRLVLLDVPALRERCGLVA
jgi:CRP/FNR family transcriptional regulator, cyclic AMP receptor protein